MQHLKLEMVPGTQAPKYSEGEEIICEGVTITERGTEAGLPIVDFKMRGADGKFYLLVLTGRMINAISSAIKGANLRNHGNPEP